MTRAVCTLLIAGALSACGGNDATVAEDVATQLKRVGERAAECATMDFTDGSVLCVAVLTGEESRGNCFELANAAAYAGVRDRNVPPQLELRLRRIACGP